MFTKKSGIIGPGGLLLGILLTGFTPLQAGEGSIGKEVKAQIWAEEGLGKVKYYLHAINPTVSNFGDPEEKLVLKHCVSRYLKSQIYFLAAQYNDSYKEIRRTELLLIQLYEGIVERSRLETHRRLIGYGHRILYGKNRGRARKYLALGLRDLEVARVKTLGEDNTRPWLYLIKLNELVEALKLTRRANRYYMLLAIEFDSIYPASREGLTYEEGKSLITSGFPGKVKEMLLIHSDNYFKIGSSRRDLLQDFLEEADLTVLNDPLPGWRLKDEPRLSDPGQ